MKAFETLIRHELFNPRTVTGAATYGLIALTIAWIVARALRLAVHEALARADRTMVDRTSASFLTQLAQIAIYVFAITFYAHLIPELRAVGTALLASVGVASVVVGLAAQTSWVTSWPAFRSSSTAPSRSTTRCKSPHRPDWKRVSSRA